MPKTCILAPDLMKNRDSLTKFKNLIKYWSPNNSFFCLRETYIVQVGFF